MIFGHQGGWDEILLVLGPITAIVVLLALAKHRADRVATQRSDETPDH